MNHREVDIRLGDFVDVVRQRVQGDVQHDLDEFCIAVAGCPDVLQRFVIDVPPFAGHGRRELGARRFASA